MSTNAVRAALEGRLATWAAARTPPLRVAWQNVAFTPAAGETYLAAFLLPAETGSEDLKGDHRAYRGVFQVSITCPIGAGAGAAFAIAALLDAHFPVNLRVTGTSLTVQVTSPASVGPAMQDPERFTVPVSIPYRADTI